MATIATAWRATAACPARASGRQGRGHVGRGLADKLSARQPKIVPSLTFPYRDRDRDAPSPTVTPAATYRHVPLLAVSCRRLPLFAVTDRRKA